MTSRRFTPAITNASSIAVGIDCALTTLPAISSGRLDMYPEYLSTWDSSVAGIKRRFHSVDAALLAGRRYAARRGLALLDPTPFSDTGGLATTVSYASIHRLRSIKDLRKVAQKLTVQG